MNYGSASIGVAPLAFAGFAYAAGLTDIPLNTPTMVDGIEAVCTGVGSSAHDPRWPAYPLKIVFAGKGGQFTTDVDVTISGKSGKVMSAHCGGPWLLVKVPSQRYLIYGDLAGQRTTTKAFPSAKKQGRVILRFVNEGGAITPGHKSAD
jgi:hypothetical protein